MYAAMHTGLNEKCCYCHTSVKYLKLGCTEKFWSTSPTSNFMKIQPPFPDCDMQTGGHTDEKITSTFLQLFIVTDQKSSAVPKYQMAGM
jgi:hypothetical protein